MNQRLEALLSGLLQPAWEDRLTAAEAQNILAGNADSRRVRQQQDQFRQNAWERSGGRSRSSGGGRQVITLSWNAQDEGMCACLQLACMLCC